MNAFKERRQYPRLNFQTKVQIVDQYQRTYTGETLDLSDSGLLIHSQFVETPQVGDVLEIVSLIIPDAVAKQVIVRRIVDSQKIAVEFI